MLGVHTGYMGEEGMLGVHIRVIGERGRHAGCTYPGYEREGGMLRIEPSLPPYYHPFHCWASKDRSLLSPVSLLS